MAVKGQGGKFIKKFHTDDLLIAEKLQKLSGVNPAVTGNRLFGDRKYTFDIDVKKAKELLEPKEAEVEEKK